MQRVYDELKTPHKYGPVLTPDKGEMYDCPTVFRHNDKWWMVFVSIERQNRLRNPARHRDDLLNWKVVGTTAEGRARLGPMASGRWHFALRHHLGRYERAGPARWQVLAQLLWREQAGLRTRSAFDRPRLTTDPTNPEPWTRLTENPVMQPSDKEARPFEQKTLYKSFIFHDAQRTLGEPFVMFYNAKQPGQWLERIGIAVSSDLRKWTRYGAGPVVENLPTKPKGASISGDPQLVRIGDLWAMVYFRMAGSPRHSILLPSPAIW